MVSATLERTQLVGRGFCSDMYAWGRGRVLKLFHGWAARDRADHEFHVTQSIHEAGLPVPAAYELLELDGRWGIVLERIDGVSLLEHIQARPWRLLGAIRQLAELHAEVHRHPAPDWLPSLKERVFAGIEDANCPPAHKQAAHARLAGLPDGDTLCHGDFHPGNVMLTRRGPIVVDWDSASRGSPIADAAYTALLMRIAHLPPWSAGYMHIFFEQLRPVVRHAYLHHYLRHNGGTWRDIDAWLPPLAVARRSWRPPSMPM